MQRPKLDESNDNSGSYIEKVISGLSIAQRKLTFPAPGFGQNLSADDYEAFLTAFAARRATFSKQINHFELILTAEDGNEAALAAGVSQYLAKLKPTRSFSASNLILKGKSFALDSITSLTANFTRLNLPTLTITADRQPNLAELIAHIETNPNIVLNLTLPDLHKHAEEQKKLDTLFESRALPLQQKQLHDTIIPEPIDEASIAKPRERHISKRKNLSIDMEMQQEQQVQVEAPIDNNKASEQNDDPIDRTLLSKKDFVSFLRNHFALKNIIFTKDDINAIPYFSESDADSIWDNWFGLTNLKPDLEIKISNSACKELLTHLQRFQFGLDLNNLPAGFKPETGADSVSYCLTFEESHKHTSKYQALKVQCEPAPTLLPVRTQEITTWLEKHAKTLSEEASAKAFAEKIEYLKSWWDELYQAKKYDRDAVIAFRKRFPQLINLPLEVVKKLHELAQENNALKTRYFDYILQNYRQLQAAIKKKDAGAAWTNLTRIFKSNSKHSNELLNCLIAIESNNLINQHDLLSTLVPDEATQLIVAKLKTNCLSGNTTGLLQVYNQYGSEGIAAIDQLLTRFNGAFSKANPATGILLGNMESLIPLITQREKYENALAAIAAFDNEKSIWWNTLLQQHCAAQHTDDLTHLIKAFQTFCNKLESMTPVALKLPAACNLQNVHSLPVVLSRIVTLLENTEPENRLTQWNSLQAFNENQLNSTGIPKAAREQGANGEAWAFFLPEQMITVSHLDLVKGKYSSQEDWKSIHSKQPGNNYRNKFTRYVGFQTRKGVLTQEFYAKTDRMIQESGLTEIVKSMVYSLVADATTKTAKTSFISSTASALEDIKEIIKLLHERKSILTVDAETIRIKLLGMLRELKSVPPLPILKNLLAHISSKTRNIGHIAVNARDLIKAFDQLNSMTAKYHSAIYTGMQNYADVEYTSKENLFYNFLQAVTVVENHFADNDPLSLAIIKIISTFKLEADCTHSLPNFLNKLAGEFSTNREQIIYLLEFLNEISYKADRPAFNLNDLINFIKDLSSNPAVKSSDDVFYWLKSRAIRDNLTRYFPENHFSGSAEKDKPFPVEVKKKLKIAFDEQADEVTKLLSLLGIEKDKKQYAAIADLFIDICSSLNTDEKSLFIRNAAAAVLEQNGSLSDLSSLLTAIKEKRGVNHFNYFIARIKKAKHKDPLLCKKAILYISAIAPNLKIVEVPNAAVQPGEDAKTIKQKELLIASSKLLMKTDQAALEGKYDSAAYSQLTDGSLKKDLFKRDDEAVYQQYGNHLATLAEQTVEISLTNKSALEIAKVISEIPPVDAQQSLKVVNEFIDQTAITANQAAEAMSETKALQVDLQLAADAPARNIAGAKSCIALATMLFAAKSNDDANALRIKHALENHPDIGINEKLIAALLANPAFQRNLSSEAVQNLLSFPVLECMSDEDLETIINALDNDLSDFADFVKLTKKSAAEMAALQKYRSSYNGTMADLYKKIGKVCEANFVSKKAFISLFETYLDDIKAISNENIKNAAGIEVIESAWNFVAKLEQLFADLEDKNAVLSLCVNFNNLNKPNYKPSDLLDLAQSINYAPEHKVLLTKIASSLINTNETLFNLGQFARICSKLKLDEHKEIFAKVLAKYYDKPPFPSIQTLNDWFDAAVDKHTTLNDASALLTAEAKKITPEAVLSEFDRVLSEAFEREIEGEYKKWERDPYDKRKPENKKAEFEFDLAHAKDQIKKFKTEKPLDETDCDLFQACITEYKELSTHELTAALDTIDKTNIIRFIALLAELLYRAKGYELYTTQYLNLAAILKSGKKITGGIKTGQGKTLIMMEALSLAYYAKTGNTVDFMTADLTLATRDYVSFQPFFDILNIKTSMIYADSPVSSYQLDHINFSDITNLNLFRNKAISKGKKLAVLADKDKRFLVLDEGDKLYYDMANTRFNYSTEADKTLRNIQWVYQYLILFFAEGRTVVSTNPLTNGKTTREIFKYIDLCREEFINFVRSIESDDNRINQLLAFSNRQLEQWQESAMTAWDIEYNVDFTIDPDQDIETAQGIKSSSEAKVLNGSRKLNNSKFSFGIHQCLHARLNYEKANLANLPNDSHYAAALKSCHSPFLITDEKQIVYSTTSKNMLDLYADGNIIAVTGTPGSDIEREEAKELHGMEFFDAPTHKAMRGKDTAYHFYPNAQAKLTGLITEVKTALANNEPILVICSDTNQVKDIAKALRAAYPASANANQIQTIDCQDDPQDEEEKIDRAGYPRMITVSTEMSGRGTDIKTIAQAKHSGLNVMGYYLAATRDEEQFVGRTRRNGETGESHIFLEPSDAEGDNTLQLVPPIPADDADEAVNTHYQLCHENLKDAARYYQTRMDMRKQVARLINYAIGDFSERFTDEFYSNPNEIVTAFEAQWGQFLSECDQARNAAQNKIHALTAEIPVSAERITELNIVLAAYQVEVHRHWQTFKNHCANEKLNGKAVPTFSDAAHELQLSPRTQRFMQREIVKPIPRPVGQAPVPPNNGHNLAGAANPAPKMSIGARLKQWMSEHPVLTGLIIGAIVGVVAAIAVVSCGAAIPAIGATAAGFGSIICAGFTTAAVSTSVAMAVGSSVAIAIGVAGSAIVGAICGLFAKFRINRKRDREVASLTSNQHDGQNPDDESGRPSKRSRSADMVASLSQKPAAAAQQPVQQQPPALPSEFGAVPGLQTNSLIKPRVETGVDIKALACEMADFHEVLLAPINQGGNDNNDNSPAQKLATVLGGSQNYLFLQFKRCIETNSHQGIAVLLNANRDLAPKLKAIVDGIKHPELAFNL